MVERRSPKPEVGGSIPSAPARRGKEMINWYIVQTFSGFEQKVAGILKETIEKQELSDKISEVLVPMHEVTVVKKGKRVQKKRNIFQVMFW